MSTNPVAIIAFSLCHYGDPQQVKPQLNWKTHNASLDGVERPAENSTHLRES
jgi:hypothetical protein